MRRNAATTSTAPPGYVVLELDRTLCRGFGACAGFGARDVRLDEWGYPVTPQSSEIVVNKAVGKAVISHCPVAAWHKKR